MSETILGTDLLTGDSVAIDTQLRQRSMYVVGIQGGGKSSFLQTLIHQDIVAGSSVIVIDPHEDLLYDVIAQLPQDKLEKTYFLDLSDRDFPFGLNIFSCANHKDDEQRDITRNRVAHMFERIWPETVGGRYFGTLLENIIDTLIENPGTTMSDIPHLLQDELFRGRCMRGLQNQEVKAYWKDDYNKKSASVQQKERDPLVSRVRELLRQTPVKNIICQKHTTFDFRRAIENKEIILINLPLRNPAYEKSAPIVGIMLMSDICRAVFSFSDIRDKEKRPRFSLFVDEYQNFTTSDFSRLFTEGRKFGIRTTVAHQERSQLDETNKNASHTAYTKVAFQTTAKDASELAAYLCVKDTRVRPENVYPDVLNHLKDHPNPDVAAFFTTYIAPVQSVAKEKVKRYRDDEVVYPKLTVGEKTFSVNPETAVGQLENLRQCFYDASCKRNYSIKSYFQLARWWRFPHAYKKRFWTASKAPVTETTRGWRMDCREVAFDANEHYFVPLLKHCGGITTWSLVEEGIYEAVVHVPLATRYQEHLDIAFLLVMLREEERALYNVVMYQQRQGTPTPFLTHYRSRKLTKDFLQSILQESPPPTKEQIDCILREKRSISGRYRDIPAYLAYVREVYTAKLRPLLPPRLQVDRTCRFLWWTYQRQLTVGESHVLAEYTQALKERCCIESAAFDLPKGLLASFDQWQDALNGSDEALLHFLGKATQDTKYVLSAVTDKDQATKLLSEQCKSWYAYTRDFLAFVRKDLEETYEQLSEDTRELKKQLETMRNDLQRSMDEHMAAEEERLNHFVKLFSATIDEVEKNPLGELKTPSSTEMKEAILSLKPRQAYVRLGTEVSHIRTLDVPEKVDKREVDARVATIRKRTRRTYCQERFLVEKAYRISEHDDEAEPHNTLPGNDGKNTKPYTFQAFEELDEG